MNYVFTIQKTDIPLIENYYDFKPIIPNDSRILMVFKSDEVTMTIYQSLKVMLQGPLAYEDYLFFADQFHFVPAPRTQETPLPQNQHHPSSHYFSSSMGSDEVGTGDFFGPVVVCTTYVPNSMIKPLETMGIKDSKQLSDDEIRRLAPILQEQLVHVVLVTDNSKYNDLIHQGYNLNKIKAYLHNHAIKKCLSKLNQKPDYVILDQFCSPKWYYNYLKDQEAYTMITFFEKAESVHLSVAAASIIARYVFLQKMDELSQSVGIILPLGAGSGVDVIGQLIVKRKGEQLLTQIAKTNFKNMERIVKRPSTEK